MTCPFTHDAAVYVLGSLSPAERLAFERHSEQCGRCRRTLLELAGLPGLLDRVDARVLEDPPLDEPVPATQLPALSRRVRRARRRRALAATSLAAAAVVAIVAPLLRSAGDGAGPPDRTPPAAVAREMAPVGDVPVRASVTLEQVAWGTRLGLTCTYDPESVDYELPPAVRYTLYVRTRAGVAERVGSWRSEGGRTLRVSAATAEPYDDIASVEVRAPDGRVVLRLGA